MILHLSLTYFSKQPKSHGAALKPQPQPCFVPLFVPCRSGRPLLLFFRQPSLTLFRTLVSPVKQFLHSPHQQWLKKARVILLRTVAFSLSPSFHHSDQKLHSPQEGRSWLWQSSHQWDAYDWVIGSRRTCSIVGGEAAALLLPLPPSAPYSSSFIFEKHEPGVLIADVCTSSQRTSFVGCRFE